MAGRNNYLKDITLALYAWTMFCIHAIRLGLILRTVVLLVALTVPTESRPAKSTSALKGPTSIGSPILESNSEESPIPGGWEDLLHPGILSVDCIAEVLQKAHKVVTLDGTTSLTEEIAKIPRQGRNAPSADKPWVVRLAPGVYKTRVTLPDYVSMIGSGAGVTTVTGGEVGSIVSDTHTIIMGEACTIADLSAFNPSTNLFGEAAIAVASVGKKEARILRCYIGNSGPKAWGRDAIYASMASGGQVLLLDSTIESGSDNVSAECAVGNMDFLAARNHVICNHAGNSIMFWLGSAGANRGATQGNRFYLYDNVGRVVKTRHSPILAFLAPMAEGNVPSFLFASGNRQPTSTAKDNLLALCRASGDIVYHGANEWRKLGDAKLAQFNLMDRQSVEQLASDSQSRRIQIECAPAIPTRTTRTLSAVRPR